MREYPQTLTVGDLFADKRHAWDRLAAELATLAQQPEGRQKDWPLSARSFLVSGERGTGKTTFLRSFRTHLHRGGIPGVLCAGDLLEVRSLDRTDRVLTGLVSRLEGVEHEHSRSARAQETAAQWVDVRRALARSDELYLRFIASNAVSEDELVSGLQRREEGTDLTRANLAGRVQDLRSRIAGGGNTMGPLLVFFLDDLDVLGLRAWEALADIDRYLSIPGLAFVFGCWLPALRLGIQRGLFREAGGEVLDEAGRAVLVQEAEDLLKKYFPPAEQLHLSGLGPRERLSFELEQGVSVRRLLAEMLPADVMDLFTAEGPVDRPHAERLPGRARTLKSLLRDLEARARRDGAGPLRHLMPAVSALLAHGDLHERWKQWWQSLTRWVESGEARSGDPLPPRSAEEVLARAICLGVAGNGPKAIQPRPGVDYSARELGYGPLPNMFSFSQEDVPEQNPAEVGGWVEFFFDLALALEPRLALDVVTAFGWMDRLRDLSLVQVMVHERLLEDIAGDEELRLAWVDEQSSVSEGKVTLRKGRLALLRRIAEAAEGNPSGAMLPPSVRGLASYLQFFEDYAARNAVRFRTGDPMRIGDLGDLRNVWHDLCLAHFRACLAGAGMHRQPATNHPSEFAAQSFFAMAVGGQRLSPRLLRAAKASLLLLPGLNPSLGKLLENLQRP